MNELYAFYTQSTNSHIHGFCTTIAENSFTVQVVKVYLFFDIRAFIVYLCWRFMSEEKQNR